MKPSIFQGIPKEGFFQAILIVTLGVATIFEKNEGALNVSISLAKLSFFCLYVIAALIISYFLLPRFFYKKRFWVFFISVFLLLSGVILIEELVLEQIFYPTSRGKSFPGFIHTLVEILPTILILVGFKFAWDAQQKQRELEQLNTRVAESQLQFLQSQVNPHFLFNNLNNLYAYALESSPKTPKIILELSDLLRYMLYDCKEKWVSLTKEIEYLANFIRLQELQIEDRGTVNFTINGQASDKRIAPLLLVVFVENCFKHSTSSMTKNIVIDISLQIAGDQLKFRCANAFSENGNTESLSKGIGLENVQTRLELLYPNAHNLTIKTANNTYLVDLELDLKTPRQ